MASKIFWAGVAVFLLIAVSFVYGDVHGLFQTLWWFDIVEHFLGGVLAGFIGAWCALVIFAKAPRMAYFIVGAVVLGAGVEVVEYFTGFGRSPFMSYPLDTAKDLVVDVVGGYIAGIVGRRLV